jgi:hypothetical protein
MRETPWFPGTIKPVYVGVYQVAYWSKTDFSYALWNGFEWKRSYSAFDAISNSAFSVFDSAFGVASHETYKNSKQNLPWRGILK